MTSFSERMAMPALLAAALSAGPAGAATISTGDTIDGKRVVTNVDLADLPVAGPCPDDEPE
jgi:hypothetical protein